MTFQAKFAKLKNAEYGNGMFARIFYSHRDTSYIHIWLLISYKIAIQNEKCSRERKTAQPNAQTSVPDAEEFLSFLKSSLRNYKSMSKLLKISRIVRNFLFGANLKIKSKCSKIELYVYLRFVKKSNRGQIFVLHKVFPPKFSLPSIYADFD